MSLQEYAIQYGIDEVLLKEYKEAGLLEELNEQCSERVQHILNSYGCLYTIGCDIHTIKEYTCAVSMEEKIKILQRVRTNTLQDLHHAKALLDGIDVLLYELKSNR